MMFESMASSSNGNAYIVSDGQTRLLVECGVSYKKLKKLCGFDSAGVAGCLVSHEHKDHSKCAKDLIASGTMVYMSCGTAGALELENTEQIRHGEQFEVGTLSVVPFTTYHDAREPLGFLIRSKLDGEVLVFAADTVNLGYQFPGVTILAVEANFDEAILDRSTHIPDKVKDRIRKSHMEIEVLCRYLKTLDLSSCREIHLMHLSDATSHEGHFIHKVQHAVPEGIRVTACGR